jgi:hypothetical protein
VGLLNFSVSAQVAFNPVYWAAQNPVIQRTFGPQAAPTRWLNGPAAVIPPNTSTANELAIVAQAQSAGDALLQTALGLVQQGYVVDYQIHVQGGDPYGTMLDRQKWGYTWWPSLGEMANFTVAPGLSEPDETPYNPNNPPSGSIKVSVNLADYPPYPVPAAPTTGTAAASPIGALLVAATATTPAVYDAVAGLCGSYIDGEVVSIGGTPYTFSRKSLFGKELWYLTPNATPTATA